MSNALIYSPSFDGHRQVYVFVLSHVLEECGYKVFIAGNTKKSYSNSFYIDKLQHNTVTKFIDTSKYAQGGINITASEFMVLQEEFNIDLTIFAEADNHLALLVSQILNGNKRFRGKLIGIFLRPFYYYNTSSILDKLKYLKHLPSKWKADDNLFHEFLLPRFKLLDTALYLDENFVDHHRNCYWLPDVFQQYADLILPDEKPEQRIWMERLLKFKESNKSRSHFLYFGTAQYRRGYDILLNLAVEKDGCFIHCGLRNTNEHFDYDTEELRYSLSQKGRLFETNQFIEDPICVDFFLLSVNHMILPYRDFYGSSGVMLQALNLGMPVLAPDKGIIGYRLKTHKLGVAYTVMDSDSLSKQYDGFAVINPKDFEQNIKSYMNYQNPNQLRQVLVWALTGIGSPINNPSVHNHD